MTVDPSKHESETQVGLLAFAPEEGAALATSQVDAGGTQVDNIGDRQASFRSVGGPSVTYRKQ